MMHISPPTAIPQKQIHDQREAEKHYHSDSSSPMLGTDSTTPERSAKMSRSRLTMTANATIVAMISILGAMAPAITFAFVETGPIPSFLGSPSAAGRATRLNYMSLEQVSDFYQNFPIQSAVLTCGVKASVADTIAQVKPQIEEQKSHRNQDTAHEATVESLSQEASLEAVSQPVPVSPYFWDTIDWEAKRNLAYVLYGGIFVGFLSHLEYGYVFPFLFGTEKSPGIVAAEVFLDNLVAAPTVWLPPACFIKAWVYGGETSTGGISSIDGKGIFRTGLEKYVADVRDHGLLWKYWTIWFPAQTVSFSVIPDHLRVAFMASISFFWFILFSAVSSQGDASNDGKTTKNAN